MKANYSPTLANAPLFLDYSQDISLIEQEIIRILNQIKYM